MQTVNKFSEIVAKLRSVGTSLANENCMHVEMKYNLWLTAAFRFNSFFGPVCCLKLRDMNTEFAYSPIILLVTLCACESLVIFREGCKLRLFEKRVLMKIFWPKWLKITG